MKLFCQNSFCSGCPLVFQLWCKWKQHCGIVANCLNFCKQMLIHPQFYSVVVIHTAKPCISPNCLNLISPVVSCQHSGPSPASLELFVKVALETNLNFTPISKIIRYRSFESNFSWSLVHKVWPSPLTARVRLTTRDTEKMTLTLRQVLPSPNILQGTKEIMLVSWTVGHKTAL